MEQVCRDVSEARDFYGCSSERGIVGFFLSTQNRFSLAGSLILLRSKSQEFKNTLAFGYIKAWRTRKVRLGRDSQLMGEISNIKKMLK